MNGTRTYTDPDTEEIVFTEPLQATDRQLQINFEGTVIKNYVEKPDTELYKSDDPFDANSSHDPTEEEIAAMEEENAQFS